MIAIGYLCMVFRVFEKRCTQLNVIMWSLLPCFSFTWSEANVSHDLLFVNIWQYTGTGVIWSSSPVEQRYHHPRAILLHISSQNNKHNIMYLISKIWTDHSDVLFQWYAIIDFIKTRPLKNNITVQTWQSYVRHALFNIDASHCIELDWLFWT